MNEGIERFMKQYGEEIQLQLVHTLCKIKANVDGDALVYMRQMLVAAISQIDEYVKTQRFIIIGDDGKHLCILPEGELTLPIGDRDGKTKN
jgi:hypothetical protein